MGSRILMLVIALLAIGVSAVATENDTPRRMLLQKRSAEQSVPVGYMIRQPVSFLDNTHECVEYSISSKGIESGSDIPILAFLMTKAQMDNADQRSRSLEHIEGSECMKAECTKEVKIPKDGDRWPFFLVLVNADHTKPEFEKEEEEDVEVGISINAKVCPPPEEKTPEEAGGAAKANQERKSKKSEVNAAFIVIPIIVFLIVAIIFVSCYIMKRRHRSTVRSAPKDNIQAEREAPLTLGSPPSHDNSLQKMDNSSPLKDTAPTTLPIIASDENALETPETLFDVPPPSYEPPPNRNSFEEDRYRMYEEHESEAPKQVYNNSLWGRLSSFRNSVKIRSLTSLKESKGSGLKSASSWKKRDPTSDVEEEDEGEGSGRNNTVMGTNSFEEDVAPAVMVADDSSSDDEDLGGGVAVAPPLEEEPEKKKTKVFVNNMYTRMMSSMSSFKSFGSFGSRKRSSGVKMKTMNSMARWAGKNTLKKGQDDVPELPEGSENSEEDFPQQQPMMDGAKEEEEEDETSRVVIPGAEHLSDSDSEVSASPLAPTPFHKMTPISGRISE